MHNSWVEKSFGDHTGGVVLTGRRSELSVFRMLLNMQCCCRPYNTDTHTHTYTIIHTCFVCMNRDFISKCMRLPCAIARLPWLRLQFGVILQGSIRPPAVSSIGPTVECELYLASRRSSRRLHGLWGCTHRYAFRGLSKVPEPKQDLWIPFGPSGALFLRFEYASFWSLYDHFLFV